MAVSESIARDAQSGYYMVSLSETVSLSYPVLADRADDAAEKLISLVESRRVRSPHAILPSEHAGTFGAARAVASCEQACERAASPFTSSERTDLLDLADAGSLREALSPQEMAQMAKSTLKRNGSGALQPSNRRHL